MMIFLDGKCIKRDVTCWAVDCKLLQSLLHFSFENGEIRMRLQIRRKSRNLPGNNQRDNECNRAETLMNRPKQSQFQMSIHCS
jgi:hypothetical protein